MKDPNDFMLVESLGEQLRKALARIDALAAELAHADDCWKAQCDAEVAHRARIAQLESELESADGAIPALGAANASIAQLKAALTKVHGIVAEYWGPCMGSIEVLLTCREAIGDSAKGWLPKVTLETKGEQG